MVPCSAQNLAKFREEDKQRKEEGTVCNCCGHGDKTFARIPVCCDGGECAGAEIPLGRPYFRSNVEADTHYCTVSQEGGVNVLRASFQLAYRATPPHVLFVPQSVSSKLDS